MSLIRILIFAALAVLVYSVYRRVTGALQHESPQQADGRLGELVQCEQCGVYADSNEALRRRIAGESHTFCGERCAAEFAEAAATAADRSP